MFVSVADSYFYLSREVTTESLVTQCPLSLNLSYHLYVSAVPLHLSVSWMLLNIITVELIIIYCEMLHLSLLVGSVCAGFTGRDCSCGRANCSMHGQCNVMSSVDGRESFSCLCDPNRTGTLCEEELV